LPARTIWGLEPLRKDYPGDSIFVAGSLIEPTAVAYNAVIERGGGIRPGDRAVILGAGPVGIVACAILKRAGASQVIISETQPQRAEMALKLGADYHVDPSKEDFAERVLEITNGIGADLFMEATGLPTCIPAMKLSIVLSTQPAQFQAATFKGNLESNLKNIAALGYNGVELAIRDPQLVDLDTVEQMVNESGLSVPVIGTGQAWGEEGLSFTDPAPAIRRRAIERIKAHLPGAVRFKAVVIIGLVRGVVKPAVGAGQAMAWLVDALCERSTAALAQGVCLALEPINRYETTLINNVSKGLELIDRVGADNFGLLLDTFHMNIEEADIEASIRQCGKRVFHFHVADSNRWHPGAGHLSFPLILHTLYATGYSGWISGEFMPLPDAEIAARQGLETLRKLELMDDYED
jgi:sugar phosphate isomerase/epimerase